MKVKTNLEGCDFNRYLDRKISIKKYRNIFSFVMIFAQISVNKFYHSLISLPIICFQDNEFFFYLAQLIKEIRWDCEFKKSKPNK